MSGRDRQRYLTETVLDQEFLDWSHDNLENRLEMVCDIETPSGTIHASDRNKYVGGTFYEALMTFPVIGRTIGEWLAPEIQFSTLTIELSNADGRFNNLLPGGADYDSWVNREIEVNMGLAEQSATYTRIFKGTITDIGGVKRSVKSITLLARDNYDRLSTTFPNQVLTKDAFPDIEDDKAGMVLPVIYGDFTVALEPSPAIVPSFVVNGADPDVIGGPLNNVDCIISENDLSLFDNTKVYLLKNEAYLLVPSSEITNVGAGNKRFEVRQNTATLWADDNGASVAYLYQTGDQFFVRVKGKDLGAYDDNLVAQAKDLLLTYGSVVSGDLDANWDTYRDKATPSQSAIVNIKSRVWRQEKTPLIQFVLSMLEQVRLEAFIDRDQQIRLNSLHFEDFVASPTFTLKNWDIVKESFSPQLDERNNFNRAQGAYDFHPDLNENARATALFRNQASITQISKEISKQIVFPNLYVETDVEAQLTEILRMASSMFEIIDLQATWRSLLQDIGDFVSIDVKIGSAQFEMVPAMIRNIGYDPNGLKIPMRVWAFQMCPFPGYVPAFPGTVGGYSATIDKET